MIAALCAIVLCLYFAWKLIAFVEMVRNRFTQRRRRGHRRRYLPAR